MFVPKKENREEIKKIEEIKNKKINLNLINYFYMFFLTHFTLFFFSGRTRMQSWGT